MMEHNYSKAPETEPTPVLTEVEIKSEVTEERFRSLDDKELDEMADWNTEKTTKMQTRWAVKIFRGYLMLIGQVADAISTPFVGFETDKWKEGIFGYGKRKSWHLVGTIFVVASFPFLFHKCFGCLQICDPTSKEELFNCWAQFIYFAPFVIIFQFGWASVQISHLSLIPVLATCDGERVELTSLRNAFTVVAGVFVYSVAWGLLHTSPTSADSECTTCTNNITSPAITPGDAVVFRNLVLIVIGFGIIFQIAFHCGTPEKCKDANKESNEGICGGNHENTESAEQVQLMKWNDWLKEIQFYQVGLLYMCTRLVVNLSQIYMVMYLTVDLHLEKDYIAIIPLIVFISGFLVSFFLRPINAFFKRKITYLIGVIIILLSCVWMWFLSIYNTPMQIFGAAILLGSGNSIILINSLSMTADLIGIQTNSAAFVYGAMSFTDKLSNGIAIVAIQNLHPCQSVIACPLTSEDFYRKTMVFVPASISLAALLILISLSRSTIGNLRKFRYGESEQITSETDQNISSSIIKKCFLCLSCKTVDSNQSSSCDDNLVDQNFMNNCDTSHGVIQTIDESD